MHSPVGGIFCGKSSAVARESSKGRESRLDLGNDDRIAPNSRYNLVTRLTNRSRSKRAHARVDVVEEREPVSALGGLRLRLERGARRFEFTLQDAKRSKR